MRYESFSVLVSAAVLTSAACSNAVSAQSDLEKAMGSSSNWASQAGDYANHRYSDLKQINASNVGQAAGGVDACPPACCAATRVRRW